MDLRRPLGGEQQPQPELAPFRGDLHQLFGESPFDRRLGMRRAQVVRLVDDDQQRAPLLSPRPQMFEHGESRDLRLRSVLEAPEVEHGRARSLVDDVDDRCRPARPQLPLEDLEVLHPIRQPDAGGVRRGPQVREHVLRIEALGLLLHVDQGVVLLGVCDGVHPQHGRLRGGDQIDEAHMEPVAVACTGAEHPDVSFRKPRRVGVARGEASLAQPGEVAVRVEDEHRQLGLQQQLLQDHPEGVGLAAAALPHPEGVPVEALRVEFGDGFGGAENCPDREVRHRRGGPFVRVAWR